MSKEGKVIKLLENLKLTRRNFLKVSAATAAVATITTLTGCSSDKKEVEKEVQKEVPVPAEKVKLVFKEIIKGGDNGKRLKCVFWRH